MGQVVASLRAKSEIALKLALATAADPVAAGHFKVAADAYSEVPIPPHTSLDAMSHREIRRLEKAKGEAGMGSMPGSKRRRTLHWYFAFRLKEAEGTPMTTSAATEIRSPVSPLVLWVGRLVGVGFAILGVVALFTSAEVESDQVAMQVLVGSLGLAGGLLFLYGLERRAHRLATVARVVGWLMMAGFAIFPGMAWMVWGPCVLLALPAAFLSRRAS